MTLTILVFLPLVAGLLQAFMPRPANFKTAASHGILSF